MSTVCRFILIVFIYHINYTQEGFCVGPIGPYRIYIQSRMDHYSNSVWAS